MGDTTLTAEAIWQEWRQDELEKYASLVEELKVMRRERIAHSSAARAWYQRRYRLNRLARGEKA